LDGWVPTWFVALLEPRGEEGFANKMLSAMRFELGGHGEKHK
jgi:6-phosphogluconate dehydrogenase (decarboxylating)